MTLVVVVVVRTVVDRHQEADATNVDEPAMIGIALVLVLVVARARARARARRRARRRARPSARRPRAWRGRRRGRRRSSTPRASAGRGTRTRGGRAPGGCDDDVMRAGVEYKKMGDGKTLIVDVPFRPLESRGVK